MKVCSRCKVEKNEGEFSKNKTKKDGLSHRCKECMKEYREANRERLSEYIKEYYIVNMEKVKEQHRGYYEANREAALERQKEYGKANKDKINEYISTRKKTSPLYAALCRLRSLICNSLKVKGFKKNTKTFELLGCSAQELLTKWGATEIPKGYQIDHICPMAQAQTVEEAEKLCHHTNLQLLPGEENLFKHDSKTEKGEVLCRELLGREWID